MDTPLTKAALRASLGTDAAVAAFFGISRAAVAQWSDEDPIPELRQLQARAKRPDLFGAAEGHPPARRTGAEGKDAGERPQTDGVPLQPAVVSEAA